MTFQLQRNYSSPNCLLLLQGFSDDSANSSEALPILSVLITAQCQIIGCEPKLSGGKDFLVNLIKAVSVYAQSFLSGVKIPLETETNAHSIHLEKRPEKNRHLLVWQENKEKEENKVELELTTVQLFDLLEAIDQLLADNRTLPELTLELHPISRRYRQGEESLIQQSTPAVLGFAGFALAAIAFLLIPMPSEIRDPRPKDAEIRENNQTTETIPETQPIPTEPSSER